MLAACLCGPIFLFFSAGRLGACVVCPPHNYLIFGGFWQLADYHNTCISHLLPVTYFLPHPLPASHLLSVTPSSCPPTSCLTPTSCHTYFLPHPLPASHLIPVTLTFCHTHILFTHFLPHTRFLSHPPTDSAVWNCVLRTSRDGRTS